MKKHLLLIPLLSLICLPMSGHAENVLVKLSPAQIKSLAVTTQSLNSFEQGGGRQLPAQVVVPPTQVEVIGAPLAGAVTKVLVAYGESVKRGQPLAQLQGAQMLELQRDYVQAQAQAEVASENRRRDEALYSDGIISSSRLSVTRAAERQANAPDSYWSCADPARQPFADDDWVLTIHSPLLAMFRGEHDFQLFAEEQLAVLPHTGAFNVEHVERRGVDAAKLSALPLDESSVLYILPHQFPRLQLSPLQRHHNTVTRRFKVSAQFHLCQEGDSTQTLVLPQPTPKRWQAYEPAFRNRPTAKAQPDDVPYWQIEISEFKE
jgi:hypothetical protein